VAHPRIFISAGEASGDLHGAGLVRALRELAPEADLAGLGGPRMRRAGVRLLADTVDFGIIGLAPLAGSFWRYLDLLSRADRFIASWRPDVAVTIDCPGFHFLLASRLRVRGVPALWYIPPQLWAWAPWRVRKLRRRFSHVACVLPHEEAFFRAAGVPVTFVGHPVADHLRSYVPDEAFMRTLRSSPDERLVAIFPGSRRQEVAGILSRQLVVAKALAARHPPCAFVIALAAEEHRAWAAGPAARSGLPIRTVVGKTHDVQKAADLALAKSGTTTLELAYYETPMAVFYNVSRTQWNLAGRWLVTTPYLALPNALAARRIVPEYMWARAPADSEIDEISGLLVDERRRREMRRDLADVRRLVARRDAAKNAAHEVLRLVGSPVVPPAAWRPGFAV